MRVFRGMEEGRRALDRETFLRDQASSPELAAGIERVFGQPMTPEEAVARIVSDVAEGGDAAVREYTRRIDGAEPESLELSREEVKRAASEAPREVLDALNTSASRVRQYHAATMPKPWMDMDNGFGEIITPVERVGVYIPGGRGAYPSTVLMTAIPARVAGVREIVLATPPRGEQGPNPEVMAAAQVAGVRQVFQIGGAQAIAAMAYGTESVPRWT